MGSGKLNKFVIVAPFPTMITAYIFYWEGYNNRGVKELAFKLPFVFGRFFWALISEH